jgi:hypothetical protein
LSKKYEGTHGYGLCSACSGDTKGETHFVCSYSERCKFYNGITDFWRPKDRKPKKSKVISKPSHSTQQLKAEIAASLEKFLSCQDEFKYDQALSDFIEQVRQLSAD